MYLIHFSMPIAHSIWQTVAVHGASVVILYYFPNPTSGSARSSVIIVRVCVHAQSLSCVRFFVTPWTMVRQDPLSKEFLGKNTDWLPFPPLGIEPVSLAVPALACGFFTRAPPGKPADS